MHGTVHVAMQVDYRFYRDHCDTLKKPAANESQATYTNKAAGRFYRTLLRTIQHTCDDVDQLSVHPVAHFHRYPRGEANENNPRNETNHRFPRQLWAAVMAVTSVFSLYETTRLQRLVTQLKDKERQMETLLRQETHRLMLLSNNNVEITQDLTEVLLLETNIASTINLISWLQQRISLVNEFKDDVSRGREIMQELRRGRISPLLVTKEEAKKLLTRVQTAARQLGGQPIIDHPEDFYQLPVSVVSDEPFLYQVVVHVGVTKEVRRLYRYHPSPIIMEQDGQRVALLVEAKKRLLVHNVNTHQELEEADLNMCQVRSNTYVCDGPTAFHTQLRSSCLGALFSTDLRSIRDHCSLRQTNLTWTAQSLGTDQVAVYFRDPTNTQTICPGDVRHNEVMQGHHLLQLPSNCSLTGSDLRINARADLLLQVPVANHPQWGPTELLDGRTPAEILELRQRLQRLSINPDPEIKHLLEQEQVQDDEERADAHNSGHNYGLYIALAGILAVGTWVFYRYGRIYARSVQTYFELKSLRSATPTPVG